MNILESGVPFEFSGGDFRGNVAETFHNRAQFRAGQHADGREHFGVGERTVNVMLP
jgi:hypothetical protein